MIRNSLIASLIILLFAGCGEKTSEDDAITETSKIVDSILTPKNWAEVAEKWSQALNQKSEVQLRKLYADTVQYYGKTWPRYLVLQNKLNSLKKFPEFEQLIKGKIKVQNYGTGDQKILSFIKTVSVGEDINDYPAYLRINANLQIVEESDNITDQNIQKIKAEKINPPDDTINGDFDGDGQLDKAWLSKPQLIEEETDCEGECNCVIHFNHGIESITVEQCIGGVPKNEQNLDGRNGDELGLLPRWWTSCWKAYFVYTYRSGKWVKLLSLNTHCMQWEKGITPVKKEGNGYIITRETKLDPESGDFKFVENRLKLP